MHENEIQVEPAGGDTYLINARDDAGVVESLFRADGAFLEENGISSSRGEDVARFMAAFLAERQPVADFPTLIDCEDIAAAYPNFVGELLTTLGS